MPTSIPILSCFAILLWWVSSSSLLKCHSISDSVHANETDRLALLAIKSQLQDPLGVTNSWNHTLNLCQWSGVTCGHRHQRVTKLDLSNQNIGGILSPHVGNLSFLRFINLANNTFHGEIPNGVGRLFRLQTLSLSNNSFSGKIPTNFSHLSNLVNFLAYSNNLEGEIPIEIYYLSKLRNLDLARNDLTGQLPASIGNLSALRAIVIRENNLSGRIPNTLGQLKNLYYLNLGQNYFFDIVPPSLYNISSLVSIYLYQNRLSGSLPLDIGVNLPNLKELVISENAFVGSLSTSLSNATNLEKFILHTNYFRGKVSINFNRLKNLSWLALARNNLGNEAANDLDFIHLLTNCSQLEKLFLADNRFRGVLPSSIANLSKAMTKITIGSNQISGNIPPGIGNLFNLNVLCLASNQLTGTIPHEIGQLENLQDLCLGDNLLHGSIPASIGNQTLLSNLDLAINNLQGNIPVSLGNCKYLIKLTLSQNNFIGPLPSQVFNLKSLLLTLDLSDNLFNGSLPQQVGNLKNLLQLNISNNQFSSEIPITLSACTSLEYLIIRGNSFQGSIPLSLSSLKSIKLMDFSSNNLSGQIPKYLENLSFLEYLNLSYNHFEGEVPTKGVFSDKTKISLAGNGKLCGGSKELHLPLCNSTTSTKTVASLLKMVIPIIVLPLLLSACCIVAYIRIRRTTHHSSSKLPIEKMFPTVSYVELNRATNEFSSANMIGQGSFGSVYKGILGENEMSVAVKVINLKQKGASRSFMAECEVLRNIRHRNLIKIITVCSSIDSKGIDFKALVYEYMQNGNLEEWLHQSNDQLKVHNLSLVQRLNISIDVACAMEYLHHHCNPPITHGDLKPSNVLLDHDMVAHVGDFGLARILFDQPLNNAPEAQSSSFAIKGTIGYVPPEYGMGSEMSMAGDVYSFGIMLLEIFTGRRPTDDMFNNGQTIREFAMIALQENTIMEIIDPSLQMEERMNNFRNHRGERIRIEECLVAIVTTGILCSMEFLSERMQMTNVVDKLKAAKQIFLGNRV